MQKCVGGKFFVGQPSGGKCKLSLNLVSRAFL